MMADIGNYDFDLAVEQIKAGVAAARALSRDFSEILTAASGAEVEARLLHKSET